METAELTLRLPKQDLEFAEQYARVRRITVSELVDRYLRRLRVWDNAQNSALSDQGEADAWQDLFHIGDALAADDSLESETLTATVLAMRR